MCIDQDNLGCIVVTENLIQTDLNDKDNLLTYVTEKAQGTFQTNFDRSPGYSKVKSRSSGANPSESGFSVRYT